MSKEHGEYLGEEPISDEGTPFEGYAPKDWALHYIACYGGIDGAHHKDWVLDQVVRILKGTPVLLTEARWADGTFDRRINTGEPSAEYLAWVEDMRGEWDEGHRA